MIIIPEGASLEHVLLGNIVTRDPLLYRFVKHVCPGVKAVHHPPHCSGFHAIISIKKQKKVKQKTLYSLRLQVM